MVPAKEDQDIIIRITRSFEAIDVSLSRLKALAKAVCTRFAGTPDAGCEVSIAIVGDAEIQKLNAQFLNRTTTTDCLSFDLSDNGEQELDGRKPRMFELIVNGEMAVRQASLRGHSCEAELALYVAHGLLHNLGFDDSTPDQARKMHSTEDEILQQIGYGCVYNSNARAQTQEGAEDP